MGTSFHRRGAPERRTAGFPDLGQFDVSKVRSTDSGDPFRAVRWSVRAPCHNLEHEDAGMMLNLGVS
jgi:FtsP/CotA-like multicopper oxidase with cupredoxin domain